MWRQWWPVLYMIPVPSMGKRSRQQLASMDGISGSALRAKYFPKLMQSRWRTLPTHGTHLLTWANLLVLLPCKVLPHQLGISGILLIRRTFYRSYDDSPWTAEWRQQQHLIAHWKLNDADSIFYCTIKSVLEMSFVRLLKPLDHVMSVSSGVL